MPSFLERLRAPLLLGDGYGSETAGESDLLSQAASMANLGRFVDLGPRARRSGGPALTFGQQVANSVPKGRSPSGGRGNMNVVYDQGPEQFNKKLALERENLAVKRDQINALNEIRQQQADAASQRADAYEYGVKNPLGQVVTPRGGNVGLVNRRTGAFTDTGVASGTMTQEDQMLEAARNALAQGAQRIQGQQDLASINNAARAVEGAANRDARAANIAAQGKAASERQEDAQAFNANRPRERSATLNQRARDVIGSNPAYADAIQFDPQGNFTIKSDIDDDLRKRVTKEIYGERKQDINLNKGADASGLNNRGGGATTVRMVAPDGRMLNVPANRVAEMEARGAKRQ